MSPALYASRTKATARVFAGSSDRKQERPEMKPLDYATFVQDCIAADTTEDHGITEDDMYGLYLSWCILHQQPPTPCESFWAAMSNMGFHEQISSNHRHIQGLRMTGPAAVDYILSSRPSLL
jgi:hypothetical protein